MLELNRRRLFGLSGTLGAAALIAACGEGGTAESTAGSTALDTAKPANLRVWFMQDSVSDAAQTWLKTEFEKKFPGSKLTIEIQQWTGIVPKLQTSLASPDSTPDIVEFGNTQVPTFAAIGALADISDLKADLGGDKLIGSFIELGSSGGKLYAAPFYAGSRVFTYRKDIFTAANLKPPTTLDELTTLCEALQKANPKQNPNWSGAFLPGVSSQSHYAWIFTHGGRLAKLDGEKWVSQFSSEPAQAAIAQLQQIWRTGSTSGSVSDPLLKRTTPFNAEETAMYFGFNYEVKNIKPELADKVGFFAFPGLKAGEPGHTFAGGSTVGISARSKQIGYAREALKLIFSQGFQEPFATAGGWVPGNLSFAQSLSATEQGKETLAAVTNSVATPANRNWAVVEAKKVIDNFFVSMGKLEDPKAGAAELDKTLNQMFNAS